ncbi:MAG: 3-deoxy-7-phosphoheptulonate synthase [Clostridia bacterium]|nr:3-deoxy-7-phosphoheptulonate synthase [Clostridia bacterium]
MIIIMKNGATKKEISDVELKLESFGFKTHPIYGDMKTVIGAIGDKRRLSMNQLLMMSGVENIVPIMRPYKLAGRELQNERSIIKVKNTEIGGNNITIFAGPSMIENKDSYIEMAEKVKNAGATVLSGGAYQPRTSPYSFHGLEEEGLKIIKEAGDVTSLPVCTEVLDTRLVNTVANYADILMIGSGNMQNYQLLKEVGKIGKPILLKRGLSATIEEWLMAAEYIMSEGNDNVILCERGIRTFEPATKSTLDLSSIPVTKDLSHLPIIAAPSRASGVSKYVPSLSKAAIAAGADGIMIEVHPSPENALSGGERAISPDSFSSLINELKPIADAVGKIL